MKPSPVQQELAKAIESRKFYQLTKSQLENMRKICASDKQYKVDIIKATDTWKGMTLERVYRVRKTNQDCTMLDYHFCVARLTDKDGHAATASRPRTLSCVVDAYTYSQPFRIRRNDNYVCQHYLDVAYDISNHAHGTYKYDISRHIGGNIVVYRTPMMETIEHSQLSTFVDYLAAERKPMSKQLFTALRISLRHNYTECSQDPYLYVRYINLCAKMKKDIHNPSVSCPQDLVEAYATIYHAYDIKQRKEREHREEERRRREALEQYKRLMSEKNKTAAYIRAKSKYLGIVIANEQYHMYVLQDIEEFFEEGNAMHHCVFQCRYYDRPNSLILSVRDSQGERVATIELNLRTMKIEQCRGIRNSCPQGYNDICKLLNDNMDIIRKAKNNRKAA